MTGMWRNREELEHQVVTLHNQRTPRRAIARACGVSRNTVRKILIAHALQRSEQHCQLSKKPERAPRPMKVDAFKPRIAELIAEYPRITVQRILEILKDEGFDGSYTALRLYVKKVRPAKKPKPSRTAPVYGPGEMAESDWSPYEVKLVGGDKVSVQAFDYVLVHSRRKYYGFYASNDIHALMDGHVRAFSRFGGCAKWCKYDGQKPVVLRWEGQQAIYNLRFIAFATHYEFSPQAVRSANAKPRAERSFWELEKSFFNGRSFSDFQDLQRQLSQWLDTIVDQRLRHGTTALHRFEQEKGDLQPLPSHHYDTARIAYHVCGIDGFVNWAGNRYAVPYDYVTDILPIRVTQNEIFIYAADLQCIARHELGERGLGMSIGASRYHPNRASHARLDADQLRDCYCRMGQGAIEFLRLMSCDGSSRWLRPARQILNLRQHYSTEDLDKALAHAARFGAFDPRAVERIVVVRSEPRSLDELVIQDTKHRLKNSRFSDTTQPRALTEYDPVPGASRAEDRSADEDPQKSERPVEADENNSERTNNCR